MADPRAFVCGHPIRHSRSPLIHGHWLQTLGLAGSYEALDRAETDARSLIAGLAHSGFVGGNITIPYKEIAFALAERRDAAAEAIGAVNTLWLENGRLVGGNTDSYGFLANLDERAPGWDSRETALVVGAGGAARAVVHGLASRGLEVVIANRTRARAEDLAAAFAPRARAVAWESRADALAGIDLLVNTTALGMEGHDTDALPVDLAGLPDHALVTDIVYTPLITPILAAAARRGLVAVDGLGMLLHQAAPGFERWFGQRPTVTPALRALVEADLGRTA